MPVKQKTAKRKLGSVWGDDRWVVVFGDLKRPKGRPPGVEPLFKCVGQKIPFGEANEVLEEVEARLSEERGTLSPNGVYAVHDSMGVVRYVGRGMIFQRLRAHKKRHPLEYEYFSFWIVATRQHEREIETLLIRGAGPLLFFNDRKKRVGIEAGSILDYEPGTLYFERQRKKGRKGSRPRASGGGSASADEGGA